MNRGKNKVVIDYSSPDIYKYYCNKTGNPHKLSQKQFTEITKQFFSEVIDMLIFDNIEFTFPKRLGNLRIIKYKNKVKLNEDGTLDKRKLRPNWKATRELWRKMYPGMSWEQIVAISDKKMVFHENKHTDGYNLKWYWDRTTCLVPNYTAYSLEIARRNDRRLAEALKNEENELNYYTQ